MEELFNAVLKNPFLLLLLVGGVISLFRRRKGTSEQQQEQKQQQQQRQSEPAPTRAKPTADSFGRNPTSQGRTVEQQVGETISTLSIEDQRKEELTRLRDKMFSKEEHQTSENKPEVADTRREVESEDLTISNARKEFQRKFKSNLTKEGLIDNIVMNEVLGHPRARQPYQSIITKRKR